MQVFFLAIPAVLFPREALAAGGQDAAAAFGGAGGADRAAVEHNPVAEIRTLFEGQDLPKLPLHLLRLLAPGKAEFI